MNSMVSLPIAAAVPVPTPSMAAANDPKAELARLEQAVELLRTRHVCEGWKMDEAGAERALRYFRQGCPDNDEEWSATIAFLSSHGLSLDWICGGDVSSMICMLASHSGRATEVRSADTQLLELEEKIFDLIHARDEFNPEISRLQDIWVDESTRLYDETLTGESTLSPSERRAIVSAMPECIEHTRLCNLQRPLDEEAGRLAKRMWDIPAKTPEGRRAKFFVLLAYFMPREWSETSDKIADCDIEYARRLMIEMIGGEPADQLRDQFAA